ncbi:major capsid protein [Pseudomonas sp. UBA1879]|uniref:major capsid protein n=1 Tax=Pseudomonas sp. UBA1879 TaxID=1947305 RepID=UPI0025FFA6C9|nr:major capsid protein [Pseudomonas sp. UBA1879]
MTLSNKPVRVGFVSKVVTLGSLMAGAGMASAAGTDIDVSAVVSSLTSGIGTVTSIGIAALSLVVVIKLFKYVKSAL